RRHRHLQQRLASQSPRRALASGRDTLSRAQQRLGQAMQAQLRSHRERLQHRAEALQLVSPLATLGRGYAIVRDDQNRIIRDAAQLTVGQSISARVGKGRVEAAVTRITSDNE
ncbi:MAG: exodeoxyribonuclease VII large subunit, partial [Marinobacter sp. 34-60-7]